MKNIFNFLKFVNENYKFEKSSDQEQLDEKLNFDSLPKSNKKDIKLNLKFRILEIKKSIKDGNLKSIDKRIILRQFKNEFTEELIDNIEFEKFVDELNDILKEGKPYSKHINKYLNKIKNY